MKKQSQAAIGRALGLSPASMSKLKGQGMPTDSVQSARTWRDRNIRPTANTPELRRTEPQVERTQSGTVENVHAWMRMAATALARGQSIASMLPTIRAEMARVPTHQRGAVLVHPDVMDLLTASVAYQLPGEDEFLASEDATMPDDEAQDMGRFWYQVAAGEIGNAD